MILKITFHDNDFTQYIENFLDEMHMDKRLIAYKLLDPYKDDTERVQEYYEISSNNDKILDDLYNDGDNIKEEHIKAFIKLFKDAFIIYLNENCLDSISYLEKNLEVNSIEAVKSKWENSEVVYWFVDYHKYITM